MSSAPRLWNVTFCCAPALAEAAGHVLEDEAVSVAVFAPPRAGKAEVEALFDRKPDAASLNARMAVLAALHKAKAPKVRVEAAGNLDWLKKVAADFPPLSIARWTVYGAAHRDKVKNVRLALRIDATSAFGTGEHPATRGCLLLLERVLKKNPSPFAERPLFFSLNALDLGCGSGILAMAFVKACRGQAVAVDCDPESVRIAAENVRVNGLSGLVRTGRSDGYRAPLVRDNAPYRLIMANIFARPLCRMARDLKRHLLPGGIAILSGILHSQANAVIAAHRAQGLQLIHRLKLGEWSALALRRPLKA